MRKTKTVNGEPHTYYYSGGKLLREIYGDTILDFFYNANGTPIAMRQSAVGSTNYTIYYYITNLQGDVIRLVDHLGQTAAYYRYDPYGKVIEASGSHANINPLRYRGYYYDVDTELYYLQSRYYDPQVGRFINADVLVSTGQGILGNNMFAYCGNNAVNMYDPTGYDYDYNVSRTRFFYAEVTHTCGGVMTFYTGGLWESDPDLVVQDRLAIARGEIYSRTIEDHHTEIYNSYKIQTTQAMREYINDTRNDNVLGSTEGVVFEWQVHNWGYNVGKWFEGTNIPGLSNLGSWFADRGEHVAYGSTIYADNHPGFSAFMWLLYGFLHTEDALADTKIAIFG